MKKSDAIRLFGSPLKTANALGTSFQAVYQWPDNLSLRISSRILGAAFMYGIPVPTEITAALKAERAAVQKKRQDRTAQKIA